MRYYLHENGIAPAHTPWTAALLRAIEARGDLRAASPDEATYVVNLTNAASPHLFRRRSKAMFVVSVIVLERPSDDFRAICYSALIRSLANLLLCIVPEEGGTRAHAWFTTPEAGFYDLPFDADAVAARIAPIVGARFATENRFVTNLPARLWNGSPAVDSLRRSGARLDALGVLPTPFPLRTLLSERDMRHLYLIFGITGASYGNLSVREQVPELGGTTFWMSARGVDKAHLGAVGTDILLVSGFEEDTGTAVLSVPPRHNPEAHCSVDAVEHWPIYERHPEVGAIIHVHAWIDGVLCTRQNYPCGTVEIAEEVADLLARVPDPSRAVVGLRNHGLTITGHSLEDIFARIEGRLRVQVPMFA